MKIVSSSNSNIGLKDFKGIREEMLINRSEIKEIILKSKPLGNVGEVIFNEIVSKGIDIISPITEVVTPNILGGFSLIPGYFMYRGIVRLFDSLAFKENMPIGDLNEYRLMRARVLRAFMICGAPLIVGSLYVIKNVTFTPNFIISNELKLDNENKEISNESVKSISLLVFFNKYPKWLKSFIFFLSLV